MFNTQGKELEVLYKVSQLIPQIGGSRTTDIPNFLEEVLDILHSGIGVLRGTFTLRRPDTDVFVVEASKGLTPEQKKKGRYLLGEGVTGQVAKTGKAAIIPDISKEPEFLNKTVDRSGERNSFICIPILHAGRVIGTMSVDLKEDTEKELYGIARFLQLITNILAEAVASIREQLSEKEALMAENKRLRQELGDRHSMTSLIGNCGNMRLIYELIAQVADSTASVLVRGESGTGKELVAKAIHYNSQRRDNPFICVNCAALPENLIESELFGHEKGSFTGAVKQRVGRFELANGGTIFLDEIGELSPSIQVRLLRVLQEQSFERVGGEATIAVNVRVIAATNRDLEKAIRTGGFREDLYYRLNVFPIHLPPLRERRSDIILLADYFLQKYSKAYGKEIKRLSTSAINMMMVYHWPGNVRELENCIERAVITSTDGVVHGYNLPPSLQTSEETRTELIPEGGADLETLVNSYEKEIITDALKKNRGNAAGAARYLRTTQRIINYKIKNLAIAPANYRTPGSSHAETVGDPSGK